AGAQPAGAALRRSRRRATRDRSPVRAARRRSRRERRSLVVVLRGAGARCRRTARGHVAAVLDGAAPVTRRLTLATVLAMMLCPSGGTAQQSPAFSSKVE